MRRIPVVLLVLSASALSAQTPVVRPGPVTPATRPVPGRGAVVALPAIDTVRRTGPSPGPAAEGFLLNGEAVRIVGRNLPAGAQPVLRQSGRILALRLNRNVPSTATEVAAYMPGADDLRAAGMTSGGRYEVALRTQDGGVLAARAITLVVRGGQRDDLDRDGSTVADDCDDFDGRRHPAAPEIADPDGVDEDCDYRSYGSRDLDGDHFDDAAAFNYDPVRREIFRGRDCDDREVTANPIRPENCPAGSSPYDRDQALRRRLGWPASR